MGGARRLPKFWIYYFNCTNGRGKNGQRATIFSNRHTLLFTLLTQYYFIESLKLQKVAQVVTSLRYTFTHSLQGTIRCKLRKRACLMLSQEKIEHPTTNFSFSKSPRPRRVRRPDSPAAGVDFPANLVRSARDRQPPTTGDDVKLLTKFILGPWCFRLTQKMSN